MADRQRRQWERLGEHDPYWGVLSHPDKANGRWKEDEFYATGEREVEFVVAHAEHLFPDLQHGTALDFGCGVGRLSRALAGHFESVRAVDISAPMLAKARENLRDRPNVEFIHNTSADLHVIADNSIDFIYSNLVLQHIPKSEQHRFVQEFLRILQPGGVAVFRTCTGSRLNTLRGIIHRLVPAPIINLGIRLVHGKNHVMEIHTYPHEEMLALLQKANAEVVQVQPQIGDGAAFHSCTYWLQKQAGEP